MFTYYRSSLALVLFKTYQIVICPYTHMNKTNAYDCQAKTSVFFWWATYGNFLDHQVCMCGMNKFFFIEKLIDFSLWFISCFLFICCFIFVVDWLVLSTLLTQQNWQFKVSIWISNYNMHIIGSLWNVFRTSHQSNGIIKWNRRKNANYERKKIGKKSVSVKSCQHSNEKCAIFLQFLWHLSQVIRMWQLHQHSKRKTRSFIFACCFFFHAIRDDFRKSTNSAKLHYIQISSCFNMFFSLHFSYHIIHM